MDFRQAKLDDQDILKDSSSGIYYTSKEWRTLVTDDTSQSIAGYHGRIASMTYARKRVITLEGVIDRLGNPYESESVKYLQNLFNLQTRTVELVARKLYIKDVYDQEWILDVKVKDPIQFLEYDGNFPGAYWKWQVTLESVKDPEYKGNTESEVSGVEGTFGGMLLSTTLPLSMDYVINYIQCTTAGNSATPARFEITCTGSIESPLVINNITDGTFFGVATNAVAGDVIIVDSDLQKVTKNGVSITALRTPGSIFPMVYETTKFSVEDLDGGIPSNDATINVFFRDSLLA